MFAAVAVALLGLLWGMGRMSRGVLPTAAPVFGKLAAAEAAALRDVRFDKDPSHLPTPYRDVLLAPAHEAPALAELVAEGKLPPLKERMPAEPVVMEGTEGVGRYGGTWLRLANAESDISGTFMWRMSGTFLCRWSPLGYPIKPFVARSITPSTDRRVWTITLRKGMRWSNGDAYTADDIMYWWNEELHNPLISSGMMPEWLLLNGDSPVLEKLSDYELRVTYPEPNALFLERLCRQSEMTGLPAKYLRKYHPDPKIGDVALIRRDMAAYRQIHPRALYGFMKSWQNPECPRLGQWIYAGYRPNAPQLFVRNPFFFAVDTAGNQLPYIDRVQFEVKEQQMMMTIAVANGAASMQDRNVDFSGYTEMMSRRTLAGTRVLHWYPASRQIWLINPNCTRRVDPADPATGKKAALLADKRFRQAMSIAINRPQIIAAEYYGIGEPSQVSPGEMSPFDNPDLAKKYTQYDPAAAGRMLDALGLTGRDYEGYRTFADGTRMTFFIDVSQFAGRGPVQFVVDDWKAVGMRVMVREINRALFYSYKDAGNFDFNTWTSESDFMPLITPRHFVANNMECFYASGWARWYSRNGMRGDPQADIGSAVNPAKSANGQPMYEAMRLYERALQLPDLAEQVRLFRQIQEIAAENVWSIGIATAPPALVVIDRHLKNVPERALVGAAYSNPSNAGIETFFFDNANSSPAVNAELKAAIITPAPRPGSQGEQSGGSLPWLLRVGFAGVVLAGAALLVFKHPFALRRLAIMVPSLLVISVIVFSIVQLPPGDFLSSRIAQLEANGDPSAKQQIEDIRVIFHTDDPIWMNYMRWMGFRWFASFQPQDQGLLQGNLGRSMESGQAVNDVVGDRVALTVVLSLATILFTWALALPIGIYSAVRQYTMGDYILTMAGFIGMSVPAFLLALVLMAVTGAAGLFSPEFAVQPGWTWPKVLDMLSHLWIPILVLAVGGTAGMIRVMRANLLDELRKPYVTTARAKGVRPLKLLLKYPVRIALNPFVSGIGHLFPALVSGGSIVAIVLSLPMVGPLLLNALFSQDVYLAGSMLMVLSLLGVLGTLVSDLLLLWLDPRIRFEGGSR